MFWLTRFEHVVLSRPAAIAGGMLVLGIILGCMSIQIGGRSYHQGPTEDGCYLQEGEVHVPGNCEQDVYYPIPFASPPNVELECIFNECTLVVQHADHFRVRNTGCLGRGVKWSAKGVRCAPQPPSEPATAAPANPDS